MNTCHTIGLASPNPLPRQAGEHGGNLLAGAKRQSRLRAARIRGFMIHQPLGGAKAKART